MLLRAVTNTTTTAQASATLDPGIIEDIMAKCVRCKRDIRAGDYNTHECSTLLTKVEVKMASRVLKRLASTSLENSLN